MKEEKKKGRKEKRKKRKGRKKGIPNDLETSENMLRTQPSSYVDNPTKS